MGSTDEDGRVMIVLWFDLEDPQEGRDQGIALGVGVTGHDEKDARDQLEAEYGEIAIGNVTEVSGIGDIEGKHVRPNMGNFLKRGIWFPNHSGVA
ncbi:hypothetical protein [Qipengyuania sp. DGS5-3]|uniref:hypothetical protein n=1 Tax=Qipengyuania sp. DGS5-3 TaxID=3349632 RepID=UPI0036D3013A